MNSGVKVGLENQHTPRGNLSHWAACLIPSVWLITSAYSGTSWKKFANIVQLMENADLPIINFALDWALYMMAHISKERNLYHKLQQTASDGIPLCNSSYPHLPWLMTSFAITTATHSKGTKMAPHGAQLSTSMVYWSLYFLPKLCSCWAAASLQHHLCLHSASCKGLKEE